MGKRIQKLALKNLASKVLNLGYVGENEHTQIIIDCSEVLWDYSEAVASVVVQPPRGDMYPVEVTRDGDNITWEIADSDLIYSGTGRVQITFTNNGEIVKSAIGNTKIEASIMATGPVPTPLENWMERAEETARQMAQDAADATVEDLAETKDECIAEIEQAGEDTRATIPSDYTQLSDDVTELKSAIDNNFNYNEIPQNVAVLNLVNSQIAELATHGVTLTKINDTSFILNGTLDATYNINLDFNAYELSEHMYYLYKRSDGVITQDGVWMQMEYFNESGTPTQTTTINQFNTVVPFTYPSAAKKSRSYMRIGSGSTFNNVKFDILAFYEKPILQTVNSILNDSIDRYNSILFLHPITSVGTQSIYVHSGDTIVINVESNTVATNAFILPYVGGDPYVTIAVGSGTYRLTATKSGWLELQQSTSTAISANAYIESRFDVKISSLENVIISGGEVYTVKKDGTGNYASFVACLKALENNSNQKTIYIYDGVYDIYEELGGDAFIATITNPSGTNWRDVNPLVSPNTKVIGCGNVTLKFTPTAEQIGSNEMAFLFSPLNISGTCEIENISIEATNCRYAIHDESSGLPQFDDTVHIYRNVRAHKTKGTYGLNPTFASGLGARCRWKFENCKFTNDIGVCWTVHTTNSVALDMATIVFDSCIFAKDDGTGQPGMMQFISGGGAHLSEKEIVNINNCYIGGRILVVGGGNGTNRYALTILNTHMGGDVVVDSSITDNPYPPEVYQ